MSLQNYNRTTWEDSPSEQTPLSADNLNHIEDGIERATAAVQTLEANVPARSSDLELQNDAGYVTPRDVWKILDMMFLEDDLRIVNGKLVYTDINGDDHVLGGN